MFEDKANNSTYVEALIGNIPAAIFYTEPFKRQAEWKPAYISPPIAAITGFPAERIIKNHDAEQFIHPEDRNSVKLRRDQAIRDKTAYTLEYRIIDALGATRWVTESGQPYLDGDNEASRMHGVIIDITERKKNEAILVESDKRFRAFVESTESIVIYLSPEGRILEFNPAAESLYGKTRQEVVGKDYFKLFLPEEIHEAVMADMKKVLAGTPTRGYENEIIRGDGCRRTVSWYVTRTLDIEGTPLGIIASGHDITERKLAEEALLSSQKMLQLVLDSIPVRVFWKDRNSVYLGCNSLFAKDVNLKSPDEIVGKKDSELSWLEQPHIFPIDGPAVMSTGTPKLRHELPYTLLNGDEIWLSTNKVPLTDLKNNVVGILGTYEDITERCRAEQQAAERNLRLKRLTELSLTLSGEPGDVFRDAARMIGELLNVRIVCLSEIRGDEIHFISVYTDGKVTVNAGFRPLNTTPCAKVAELKTMLVMNGVIEAFPDADFLKEYNANFYCGFPALDSEGNVAAITCLLDSKPHKFTEEDHGLLRIFGQRIAVEIERQRHLDAQAKAKEQMKKLSSAIEQTADVVLITDRDGIIEYVNPAFEAVTGYSYAEVKGKSSDIVMSSKHDTKFYTRLWDTILRGEVFQDVIMNRKKNGEIYYEEKTITPLKNHDGTITHFISTGKDITERMQTQERLYHLAYHDILTQLPNRGLFVDRLNHALVRMRNPEKFVAVLFMDLDRFKIINDTLGHDTGDHLLKMLSQRIIKCLREGDTVARLAGDEFVILLEDITADDDVAPICRKILDSFEQPFQIEGKELFVTASIGISISPSDGKDAASLIRNADIAMYKAKELGRNNFQFYSAEMSAKAHERLTLETSLRHALKRDEFVLYYQPQISPVTGRILGVETLLRWRHRDLGLLLPDQFISLLEETGLIIPVGEWVLQTAFCQAKIWQEMAYSPLRVSVNISSRQFDASCIKRVVIDLIDQIGIDSRWVGLEITETLLMKNDDRIAEALQALSDAGVQLSIDDFGTGYSSLSYLRRLPVDTLKIDSSFMRDVIANPDDAAIVQAIIAMAKILKMNVIAEGVETKEQLDFVQDHCASIQGFLFSEPLPVEDISELLRQDNEGGIDWGSLIST